MENWRLRAIHYYESIANSYDDYADQFSDFPLKHEANKAQAREYQRLADNLRSRVMED